MFSLCFSALLCLSGIASALPPASAPKPLLRSKTPIPGRYIVKLKTAAIAGPGQRQASPAFSGITHRYTDGQWNGFAGNFSSETLQQLLASPDVEFVEEDGVVNITADTGTGSTALHEKRALNAQTDAPWGLARISQDAKLTNQNTGGVFTYTYGAQAGQGVDIYVLDTGILTTHSEFGGRASNGAVFGGYSNADGNGHGTHCAATAAGNRYGVAKLAKVISVKVLSDSGSGSISDIIAGIDWIRSAAAASNRPSVILAALGGGPSTALDSAVTTATNAGIAFVTTAGNSNSDAGNFSPGRVPSAITVGASTIADAVSASSNHGAALKLYAPGQNVLSAWIGSTAATNTLSGGSSAAAHVAGLAAYLLSVIPSSLPVATALANTAVQGVLANVPAGTANRLASNNVSRLGIAL